MAKTPWLLEWVKMLKGQNYTSEEIGEILGDAANNPTQYGWSNPNPHQYDELTAQEYYERLVNQGHSIENAEALTRKAYNLD